MQQSERRALANLAGEFQATADLMDDSSSYARAMLYAATRIQSILDQEFPPDPLRTFYIYHSDYPRLGAAEAEYEARSPEEALSYFFEDRVPNHSNHQRYFAYNDEYTEAKA